MQHENSFLLEWKAMNNLLRRCVEENALCETVQQLTQMQIFVLAYLYQNRDHAVYQRDLETEFLIRRSTITELLKGMEQKNLIVRIAVAKDARLKQIVLTPQAVALHEAIEQAMRNMEQMVLQDLTQQEIQEFYRILGKVKQNLMQMQSQEGKEKESERFYEKRKEAFDLLLADCVGRYVFDQLAGIALVCRESSTRG